MAGKSETFQLIKTALRIGAFFILVFPLLFLTTAEPSIADGIVVNFDPYSYGFYYGEETDQTAFINYENGLEKMILTVTVKPTNYNIIPSESFWIFPVPSEPDKVVLDIFKTVPYLNGEEINSKAKQLLRDTENSLFMTQLYTIPLMDIFATKGGYAQKDITDPNFDMPLTGEAQPSVTVYEHLEKEGVVSELITADTSDALYDYLKNKGLNIATDSIPILGNYMGKNFSFVVSWLNESILSRTDSEIESELFNMYFGDPTGSTRFPSLTSVIEAMKAKYPDFAIHPAPSAYLKSPEGRDMLEELIGYIKTDPTLLPKSAPPQYPTTSMQRGVFVTFPTDRIYFPLMPTGVYDSKVVPAHIRILGFVTPEIPDLIKSYVTTEYYYAENFSLQEELKPFYNGKPGNLKYTKININAPSKLLLKDLFVDQTTPRKTGHLMFLISNYEFLFFFALIFCSLIAGLIAGLIAFRGMKKFGTLALVGLANCLTIVGVVISIAFLNLSSKSEEINQLVSEIRRKGYIGKRKLGGALLLYSVPFLIFGFIIFPLFVHNLNVIDWGGKNDEFVNILFIFIFPIIALKFALDLVKVKPEDKNLFEELYAKGISPWTFGKSDSRKYSFVPVFSVTFLILSWLFITILQLGI